jgi:hypothetical protein
MRYYRVTVMFLPPNANRHLYNVDYKAESVNLN